MESPGPLDLDLVLKEAPHHQVLVLLVLMISILAVQSSEKLVFLAGYVLSLQDDLLLIHLIQQETEVEY